jgi:hypothetical protein
MRILVSRQLTVSLLEPDDFKHFDVCVEMPADRLDDVRTALEGIAELDGSKVAWVDSDWIVRAADTSRDAWHDGFAKMTAYASERGWVRHSPAQIRAHLIWQENDVPDAQT